MSSTVWCIGKNYLLHAKELNQPVEDKPIVFIKSSSCIVNETSLIYLPSFSDHIDYEVELALLLDKNLNFSHVSVALDLTARDIQQECKKKGLPWTLAKSFKQSLPIGKWKKLSNGNDPFIFSLFVNGQQRQNGSSSDMLFSIEDLRNYLLERFPLSEGDIVLTGTPQGISQVLPHDCASVFLNGEKVGEWNFV
jgi:2-keto-4-pentenoate hydratase/2-oxohepta-3-ene-1,7-dioic acid hydratase in catechol pathway